MIGISDIIGYTYAVRVLIIYFVIGHTQIIAFKIDMLKLMIPGHLLKKIVACVKALLG